MGVEWGQFHDKAGKLKSVPADWTSLHSPDLFSAISEGRSHFRLDDLSTLVEIVNEQKRNCRKKSIKKTHGDDNNV